MQQSRVMDHFSIVKGRAILDLSAAGNTVAASRSTAGAAGLLAEHVTYGPFRFGRTPGIG